MAKLIATYQNLASNSAKVLTYTDGKLTGFAKTRNGVTVLSKVLTYDPNNQLSQVATTIDGVTTTETYNFTGTVLTTTTIS